MSLVFKKPKKTCNDRNCPFHGDLPVRGRVFEGVVASAKMDKTVIVKRGDTVRIAECRPISKTVSFVVVEKLEEA